MWFEELTGFREESPEQARELIEIRDNKLISKINSKEYTYGKLEIPTLESFRNRIQSVNKYKSRIQIKEIVGDIKVLQQHKENNGAFFQAASQFNLLEMTGPHKTPEDGIGIYENDYTQGPACAIACGAGTIYRNYFVKVDGQTGQTSSNQIDCLKDLGNILENDKYNLWEMSNGYALATRKGLEHINNLLENISTQEYEKIKGKLKIGIQWNTEVTVNQSKNIVTQAYCSALPVAYSSIEPPMWEGFARLILEASYELTFLAALKNFEKTGNNKVFLTLVGGGAFGNDYKWIFDAIKYSILKFHNTPLEINIVSYGSSNPMVNQFIDKLNKEL